MADPTLTQLSLTRRQAAAELEAAEAAEAALQAQLAAATAFTAAKRDNLAAAERALRAGEDEALKQLVLAPLFPELASLVFAQLLPVDSRLRCREVCRGWRAFLADARHWQVLDLSLSSGVARRLLALLRAASERAQGTLRELDESGWYHMPVREEALGNEQLLPILRSNAFSLLELRSGVPAVVNFFSADDECCCLSVHCTQVCARPASPVTTPPAPSSPRLSAAPVTRVSWSAWARRTRTSATRPSPSVVC